MLLYIQSIGHKTDFLQYNLKLQENYLFFFPNPHFTLHQTMKFLTIFSLLLVTLLARNRKHYLVEVEDNNEINDEKDMNEYEEENVFNHEKKNTEKGKNVKPEPRKVFKLFRYFLTNINNTK